MGARIPRKKGQPANSKKHSDLYTDENPKGTIHGLGFKNPAKAKQSLVKIKNSNRSHAHKTQAAIAMEQRAREMGKTTEANIYRRFIEQQKKKTKQMNKMDLSMRLFKEEVDDEAFKRSAYSLMDEGWADHLPEDFDHEGFDAENYNEIIDREYPTGQSGYSPGIKELRRSLYNHYESPEENEKRFRDLMDNPTREPILVVRDKNGEEHIIAGHHRMAASIESNRPHLPALILDMNVAKSTQPLYGWLASANTMNPFERSYMLLKSDGFIDNLIKMGREQDAMQMQAMRQFVLENQNSSDPALREAAEEMYGYLTQLMGYMGSDRTGESPQMPQVAGFNAPLPDTPRPPMADNVEANRPMGVPAEHPMIGKSAIDMAWDMLQKKMRGGGGAVQLAGYPQSREYSDSSRDGASLPPRQTTRHQIMREMEQGKREGAPEPPMSDDEEEAEAEHKNMKAMAELFGMKTKPRTIGDANEGRIEMM
jgi:hypothetical protein